MKCAFAFVLVAGIVFCSGAEAGKKNPDRVVPKGDFIDLVRNTMQATEGNINGLSFPFFSVGDEEKFLPAIRSYLYGVAIDPNYLGANRQGLTQCRGWGNPYLPGSEFDPNYNGWIILKDDQNTTAAFHEAIHAYHCAIGSDVDDDSVGQGPEMISNPSNFYGLVTNLRTIIDPLIDRLLQKIGRGEAFDAEEREFQRRIRSMKMLMDTFTPQFHQCLRNIGGFADWQRFEEAYAKAKADAAQQRDNPPDCAGALQRTAVLLATMQSKGIRIEKDYKQVMDFWGEVGKLDVDQRISNLTERTGKVEQAAGSFSSGMSQEANEAEALELEIPTIGDAATQEEMTVENLLSAANERAAQVCLAAGLAQKEKANAETHLNAAGTQLAALQTILTQYAGSLAKLNALVSKAQQAGDNAQKLSDRINAFVKAYLARQETLKSLRNARDQVSELQGKSETRINSIVADADKAKELKDKILALSKNCETDSQVSKIVEQAISRNEVLQARSRSARDYQSWFHEVKSRAQTSLKQADREDLQTLYESAQEIGITANDDVVAAGELLLDVRAGKDTAEVFRVKIEQAVQAAKKCIDDVPAPAQKLEFSASSDQPHPVLVPPGMQVVPFGQSDVDGWAPFRFQASVPAGKITGASIVLDIKPIGQLIDTDTLHCLDGQGQWYTVYDNFESLTPQQRVTITVDVPDIGKLEGSIRNGILRCTLQDDTALYDAKLQVFIGGK